jgi:hypothetical protein
MCVVLFAAGMGPSLWADENYGEPAGTVLVPAGLTQEEVASGITEAAAGRGWTIRKKGDDHVVIFLEKRGWVSNLTLTYGKDDIQIFSKTVKKGKPELPSGWIDNLKKDLTRILNSKAVLK